MERRPTARSENAAASLRKNFIPYIQTNANHSNSANRRALLYTKGAGESILQRFRPPAIIIKVELRIERKMDFDPKPED